MTPAPHTLNQRLRRFWPWMYWVLWFDAAWLVIVIAGGYWQRVVEHWAIAMTMVAGSYVAGSTPMGGGTVGFPILVLLFDHPAGLGRNFSFVIQAVGMSSATILLLVARRHIAARFAAWTCASSLVVTPCVLAWVTPHVSDAVVKLVFACIWGSFGILTLVKLGELLHSHKVPRLGARFDAPCGIVIGLVGGLAAGLTGVGIDMVAYTVLVLLYRCDLRIAISTSVVIMAFTSLVGSVTIAARGEMTDELLFNWLAAAPVVLLGAPLGALMLYVVPRKPTLIFVSILCIAQLVWTWHNLGGGLARAGLIVVAVLAMNAVFHVLYTRGKTLAKGREARPPVQA